jgi:NADH-quinone oxidoreductase subunit L
MTHAFFKALLFLAAGSVIHAMGGEQDMNRMGGLSKKIRWTYMTMLMATLAIAGAPGFSGFFSKDAILLAAADNYWLYGFGLLTALLTSFYMFRLIFLTFHGKQHFDEHHVHVHESPRSMLVPLAILAVLSLAGGWMAAPEFWGGENYFEKFLEPAFANPSEPITQIPVDPSTGTGKFLIAFGHALGTMSRQVLWTFAAIAVGVALIGFIVAYWLYLKRPEKADGLAKSLKPAYTTLLNKYYVDELYAAVVVKPLLWISTNVLWKAADVAGIDGAVNGIAAGTTAIGDGVRHTQSGNTRSYAVWVVVGAIVIIAVIFFWPSGGKPILGMVR